MTHSRPSEPLTGGAATEAAELVRSAAGRGSGRLLASALSGACLLLAHGLSTDSVAATTGSQLSLSTLSISPVSGTIEFAGPWAVETFVTASNSLGQLDSQFSDAIGGPASVSTSISWAQASSSGSAAALTGSVTTSLDVSAPGALSAAATATGNFSNVFMITGGSGTVNVAIGGHLGGTLSASAADSGSTEVIFSMEIAGAGPSLFYNAQLASGNSPQTFDLTLSQVQTLTFGTPYAVNISYDSESVVRTIPEPPAVLLIAAGLCAVAALAGRRRRRATP